MTKILYETGSCLHDFKIGYWGGDLDNPNTATFWFTLTSNNTDEKPYSIGLSPKGAKDIIKAISSALGVDVYICETREDKENLQDALTDELYRDNAHD